MSPHIMVFNYLFNHGGHTIEICLKSTYWIVLYSSLLYTDEFKFFIDSATTTSLHNESSDWRLVKLFSQLCETLQST